MENRIKSSIQILKKHGFTDSTVHLFHWVIQKLKGGKYKYRNVYLYILDKPRPNPRSIEAAKNHTFKFATLDDLKLLQKTPDFDIHDADISAFENGDRCLLQLDENELVGYAWLASSNLVKIEWGFHFNMPDDTVYNYKGYTSPKYRGKGFQPLRHLKLLELVKTEGQKQLFGYVDQMNLNSQKGVRKSGYTKVGVLKCSRNENLIDFSLKVSRKNWSLQVRT